MSQPIVRNGFSSKGTVRGTFHFHSTYSHDGLTTLAETVERLQRQGFAFVIMTEHFEDFPDPGKFDAYLAEVAALNESSSFIVIPGMEVNLEGIDTITFPVSRYDDCLHLLKGHAPRESVRVVAHPSKYTFQKVVAHLEKYDIHGIELWNQQADGSAFPPLKFLQELQAKVSGRTYRYFFGCDLHDVRLTVTNMLVLARGDVVSAASVCSAIRRGDFASLNTTTGLDYRNGPERDDLKLWIDKAHRSSSSCKRKIMRGIRTALKAGFKRLPKPMQRSMNNLKNVVRNKI